jgi:hypothetical protein
MLKSSYLSSLLNFFSFSFSFSFLTCGDLMEGSLASLAPGSAAAAIAAAWAAEVMRPCSRANIFLLSRSFNLSLYLST